MLWLKIKKFLREFEKLYDALTAARALFKGCNVMA